MVEPNKEKKEGIGLGKLLVVGVVFIVIVVSLSIYNTVMEPYNTADTLRDILTQKNNISEDYKDGWLDCVDYYLKMKTEPRNASVINWW